jgi:hypothetical protein
LLYELPYSICLLLGELTMKSGFLNENRRFLKLCSRMARLYGVLCLIVAGGIVVLLIVGLVSDSPVAGFTLTRTQISWALPRVTFHGLLALLAAEFIGYLLAGGGEPRWLLRHGAKIIYAYAVSLVVMSVYTHLYIVSDATARGLARFGHGVFGILFTAAAALMWIGIGITLHKVIPIIKESKTLV